MQISNGEKTATFDSKNTPVIGPSKISILAELSGNVFSGCDSADDTINSLYLKLNDFLVNGDKISCVKLAECKSQHDEVKECKSAFETSFDLMCGRIAEINIKLSFLLENLTV